MATYDKSCDASDVIQLSYDPAQRVHAAIENKGDCKVIVEYDIPDETLPDKKRFKPGETGKFTGDEVKVARISCRKSSGNTNNCTFEYSIITG